MGYIVRSKDVNAYNPANHLETENRRLIGPETVGATNIEVVLGLVGKGGGKFFEGDALSLNLVYDPH